MIGESEGPILIAGLGNPGTRFRHNRHNVGFMLLDRLARKLGSSFRRVQMKALVTDLRVRGQKAILVKPQTMMNLVGESIGPLVHYYRVPLSGLLVVYDDLDLPFGDLRLRPAGGSGGHKGMRSIIHALDHQSFPRLRIGIGRPPGRLDPADYVLQDFSLSEKEILEITLGDAVDCVLAMIELGVERAMNGCNKSEP